MKERSFCFVSSCMNILYLIGGWVISKNKNLSLCYTYDTNINTWNKLANLNIAREFAACTVFERKIVVT